MRTQIYTHAIDTKMSNCEHRLNLQSIARVGLASHMIKTKHKSIDAHRQSFDRHLRSHDCQKHRSATRQNTIGSNLIARQNTNANELVIYQNHPMYQSSYLSLHANANRPKAGNIKSLPTQWKTMSCILTNTNDVRMTNTTNGWAGLPRQNDSILL